MKTKLNLKGIQLGDLKIGDIVLEQEYTVSEAAGMMNAGKQFVAGLIKDLPEMLLDLEGAYETLQEIEERQSVESDFLNKAIAMEHHRAYQEAFGNKEECHCEDECESCTCKEEPKSANEKLRDFLNNFENENPNIKVRVVGPRDISEEDVPDEIKQALKHVIGKIHRGEIR